MEEVAREEYFRVRGTVPPVDTEVAVRKTLVGGRVAVETLHGGQVIGYLPTKYLYLWKCMEQGYTYHGNVVASSMGKSPVVRIDLAPARRPKT